MHALNDQKIRWNMTLSGIGWLDSSSAGIVWILTIVPGTKNCKASRYLGSMLYDSSQLPYTYLRAHCFASHALRYVMVYPNSCLMNTMNVGMVSCSFSSTIARIFLPTSFESILLWFFLSDALSFHWHLSTGQHKTHVSFTHLLALKVTWFLMCHIFTVCFRSSIDEIADQHTTRHCASQIVVIGPKNAYSQGCQALGFHQHQNYLDMDDRHFQMMFVGKGIVCHYCLCCRRCCCSPKFHLHRHWSHQQLHPTTHFKPGSHVTLSNMDISSWVDIYLGDLI